MTLQIKKDESQSSAAETDGRNDTYDVRKKKKKKSQARRQTGPTLGCVSNAIRNWREGISLSFFVCVCVRLLYMAESIWTPLPTHFYAVVVKECLSQFSVPRF